MLSRPLDHAFLAAYRLTSRAWAKFFSFAASGAFASFGRRSVLRPPIRLHGQTRIAIGSGVFVGSPARVVRDIAPEEVLA